MNFIDREKYHRFSGKVSPAFLIFFILGAVIVAILSVIYALAMYFMPIIYLCVLVTMALGAGMGFFASKAMQLGKARNIVVVSLALLVFYAIFVYVHFAAYAAVVYRDAGIIDFEIFLFLLSYPSLILDVYVGDIIPIGVWSFTNMGSTVSESTVSGGFLVFIWVIEHLLVGYLSVRELMKAFKKPFFEISGKWGTLEQCEFWWKYQPETAFDSLKEALESENTEFFRSLESEYPYATHKCSLSCYIDPDGLSDEVYLSLENEIITTSKKGQKTTKTKKIVNKLRFPVVAYRRLEDIAKEAAAKLPPPESFQMQSPETGQMPSPDFAHMSSPESTQLPPPESAQMQPPDLVAPASPRTIYCTLCGSPYIQGQSCPNGCIN